MKPVIAFASTMGSFVEQMENENGMPVKDGDTINANFSEVLMRGLDGVFTLHRKRCKRRKHLQAIQYV